MLAGNGVLSVGLAPSVAQTPLLDALYKYRQGNPSVELQLKEMNSIDMVTTLLLNQIDVALMRQIAAFDDIETHNIYEEAVGLFC